MTSSRTSRAVSNYTRKPVKSTWSEEEQNETIVGRLIKNAAAIGGLNLQLANSVKDIESGKN